MKLVFLLEERSMKELLDLLLPRILPESVTFQTVPHEGKSDLEKSLPIKLKGWNEPDVSFVVVHDQDFNDCVELKQKLLQPCQDSGKTVLVRIACHELEAWYWGDLDAVEAAYGRDVSKLKQKAKYRVPDRIENPKQELKRLIPDMGQIDGARRIAPHMNIDRNTSYSFQVFVRGIRQLCEGRA
ncbi:MAG: DUF4276 family protein [Succinivibrionaceae bacterium]|nr:DUF4276 family protein [Succinivibrionaceae bacterium]